MMSDLQEQLNAEVEKKRAVVADFKAQKAENRKLKARLDELEAAAKERLEEEGNFKSLYEAEQRKTADLKKRIGRIAELESIISESNKRLIEQIPEGKRDLLPDIAPEHLHTMLPRWIAEFQPPAPVDIGGAQEPTDPKPILTPAQRIAYQMSNFKSEEEYLEAAKRYG